MRKNNSVLFKDCAQIWQERGSVIDGPAWIVVEKGIIKDVGVGQHPDVSGDFDVVDCKGRAVIPGLVECHTHTVFAGKRADEFVMRAKGVSYTQIAKKGGGILKTVKATVDASFDELVESGLRRLNRFLSHGVTTVEIKSGYGLDLDNEIKMLKVIKRLNELHPVRVIPTLLAHMIPPWVKDRMAYVQDIAEVWIPTVKSMGLANTFDVFVDNVAFSVDEARVMLDAAKMAGMNIRVHAEQLSHTGAARLAAEFGARSADHLDQATDGDLQALSRSDTVGVLIPGCAVSMSLLDFPDARRFMGKGVRVALSTDFNPGSSVTQNLALMGSFGIAFMGMDFDWVMEAITYNPAYVLDMSGQIGKLKIGFKADIVLLDTPDYQDLFYEYGTNHVDSVFINGALVYPSYGGSDE